ncbi:protein of unknown function [Georgfuchsia toluolica]|uniref:Uncharacterized protein n=1 Tax=Georgfuchsia toluolica TaxID=424218 RepID=A0A916J1V5_9PROT|nr:protein of unknown function [Georgfuchsia toluolica]
MHCWNGKRSIPTSLTTSWPASRRASPSRVRRLPRRRRIAAAHPARRQARRRLLELTRIRKRPLGSGLFCYLHFLHGLGMKAGNKIYFALMPDAIVVMRVKTGLPDFYVATRYLVFELAPKKKQTATMTTTANGTNKLTLMNHSHKSCTRQRLYTSP